MNPGYYDEHSRKFWSIYVDEAKRFDTALTETWKSGMDSTMIFAGLFSATITAFIVESSKRLFDDSGARVASLLEDILAVQLATVSQNASSPILRSHSQFSPTASDVAINILWFLSLTCSLAAALCVTLVQRWIRDYLQRVERYSQPQQRARVRGYLFEGIEKWRMDKVIEFIPTLLHVSLFLFFAGLCIFLRPDINAAVTAAVISVVFCCVAFYGFVTIAPLLDASAPYQTHLSSILWTLLQRVRHLCAPFAFVHKCKVQANLDATREQMALYPVDAFGPSRERDSHALRWVFHMISDDWELERFVESIPGLLRSNDGRFVWRDAFHALPGSVEIRILSLLKRTQDTSGFGESQRSLKRRIDLCRNALAAISLPLVPNWTGC